MFVKDSTDTGYYVGPAYNLETLTINVGNNSAGNMYSRLQHPIWAMKSVLKTAGWKIAAWGSGSSTGTYSDPYTDAEQMIGNSNWFVITQPNSSRSFSFQKSSVNADNEGSIANFHGRSYRIKYAPDGFAVTASLSATVTPGAISGSTMELVVLGGGTDASPTFASVIPETYDANYQVFYSVYAQNTAPYGWYMFFWRQYEGIRFFGLEPVVEGPSQDQDPYVVHMAAAEQTGFFNYGDDWDGSSTGKRLGFLGYKAASQFSGSLFIGVSLRPAINDNNGASSAPIGLLDRYKHGIYAYPMMYVATGSAISPVNVAITGSFKGFASFIKQSPAAGDNGGGTGGFPDCTTTFSFFSRDDALLVNSTLLPWFGEEVRQI